jgi:hypothetical protein
MAKRCIPGVICVENMTLFVLTILLIVVIYLYYSLVVKPTNIVIVSPNDQLSSNRNHTLVNIPTRGDTLNDPYVPPYKNDYLDYPINNLDIRGTPGIPVNIKTRGISADYEQKGILTKNGRTNGDSLILPLMGRKTMNGRDKWNYYTISNTGNINTKLPISLNGKSCTSENGCDPLSNGDNVYVEGYNDTFKVTVYENGLFSYIPYL